MNQRVATIAPNTIAVSPVPKPTMTPQNRTRCQSRVITRAPMSPISISARATNTTRLKPYLSISAAVNGAIRPNRTMRRASATEICSVLQPNSLVSGMMSAPEMPMHPAVVRSQQKDDGDCRPAIVNAGALEPPRQSLSEHEGSLRALSYPPGADPQRTGGRLNWACADCVSRKAEFASKRAHFKTIADISRP